MEYKKIASECRVRADIYNRADAVWLAKHETDCSTAITDLLNRAEAAEARCASLDEARENANAACAKWEGLYTMALERAEKAERERDAAVSDLTFAVNEYRRITTDIDLCGLCEFDLPPAGENGQTAECPGFRENNCFKWRGQKEDRP